jgi:queuine tRNA-ribosyltransferase
MQHDVNTHAGLSFRATGSDGRARTGRLWTAHGVVETPAFMAVGTAGTVKGLTADGVRATGTQCILGNTYHLMLRPGGDMVEAAGGLHKFADWAGPILTDSGGFQIMSLAALRKLDADGVTFRSHIDGSRHRLTPASCMRLQQQFDSTITMVLDECIAFPAEHDAARRSMALSLRWAALSRDAFQARPGYGLFAIVQGSTYQDLRRTSAISLRDIGFDGYAVGGLAVGEGQAIMLSVLDTTLLHLPEDSPRYLMGVGTPDDILAAVALGVDMFDCVIPTRAGRTARAYTSGGVRNLRNARYAADFSPLDPDCLCLACTNHTRAYLHHLFRAREMLGPILLTSHNLTYYQRLMSDIRSAVMAKCLASHAASVRARWNAGDTV